MEIFEYYFNYICSRWEDESFLHILATFRQVMKGAIIIDR